MAWSTLQKAMGTIIKEHQPPSLIVGKSVFDEIEENIDMNFTSYKGIPIYKDVCMNNSFEEKNMEKMKTFGKFSVGSNKKKTGKVFTDIMKCIFPETVSSIFNYYVEGVRFYYVNSGTSWDSEFGGILLSIEDSCDSYKKIIRKVMVNKKNGIIDLDKIVEKYKELKIMKLASDQKKVEKHKIWKSAQDYTEALKMNAGIEGSDKLMKTLGEGQYTLVVKVDEDEIGPIMEAVHRVREAKTLEEKFEAQNPIYEKKKIKK